MPLKGGLQLSCHQDVISLHADAVCSGRCTIFCIFSFHISPLNSTSLRFHHLKHNLKLVLYSYQPSAMPLLCAHNVLQQTIYILHYMVYALSYFFFKKTYIFVGVEYFYEFFFMKMYANKCIISISTIEIWTRCHQLKLYLMRPNFCYRSAIFSGNMRAINNCQVVVQSAYNSSPSLKKHKFM